jgi:hypothetical protein
MQYPSFILEEIWSRNNASYLLIYLHCQQEVAMGIFKKKKKPDDKDKQILKG